VVACFLSSAQSFIHAQDDYQKPEPLINAIRLHAGISAPAFQALYSSPLCGSYYSCGFSYRVHRPYSKAIYLSGNAGRTHSVFFIPENPNLDFGFSGMLHNLK
jgi:hypothetical protein